MASAEPDRTAERAAGRTPDRTADRTAGRASDTAADALTPGGAAAATAAVRWLDDVVGTLPGGGEDRDGQRRMVAAVAAAVAEGRHLVVQAGTGTGKSLGYLVPVALSGRRTVVVTATKALQDQLAGKDLPFVADALGPAADGGLTFALLKGRSNYFCRQRAAELQSAQRAAAVTGTQLVIDGAEGGRGLPPAVTEEVGRLVTWAGNTTSGDRAELAFEPSAAAWSLVSVTAAECPGRARCPSGDTCFAELARERAAEADVVVVNTHLYGQHVRSGGWILPAHDVVVIDEAHELEDIVADSLGTDIGSSRLTFLAGRLRSVIADADSAVDLAAAARGLDEALTPFAGQRLQPGPAAHTGIRRALASALGRVQAAIELVRTAGNAAAGNADLAARCTRATLAATQLADDIERALDVGTAPPAVLGSRPGTPPTPRTAPRTAPATTPAPSEQDRATDDGPAEGAGSDAVAASSADLVAWVEAGGPNRGPVLRLAPVEVGGPLAATVWDRITAVLTSATIPTSLAERVGLPPDHTTELRVGSPFAYDTNALLYCAVHLPDPRSAAFEPATHEELAALVTAAGGRTLALFTSWRAMRAADALRDRLRRSGIEVLIQGDLPKPVLLDRFATEETTCLFATMGFWQGIDVPGRSLSLVTIDKLPFGRPDEPLLVARRERAGPRAFELIDLPRAAMLLAQGAGRLIRTAGDRGVVAVFDPRLNTARYRWSLIEALPPMRRTRDRAEAERFLRTVTA